MLVAQSDTGSAKAIQVKADGKGNGPAGGVMAEHLFHSGRLLANNGFKTTAVAADSVATASNSRLT